MSAHVLLADAAKHFRERLSSETDVENVPISFGMKPTEHVVWENYLLKSPKFRHAHVEVFSVPDRIFVLHVCIFPHLDDPGPIYGYDIIAGSSKVTGLFLDLTAPLYDAETPGLPEMVAHFDKLRFSERRTLPEWGKVFSPNVIAIRPVDLSELSLADQVARTALDRLLDRPSQSDPSLIEKITEGHRNYILAQRSNVHTFRMLSGFIGKHHAKNFIDNILFPQI